MVDRVDVVFYLYLGDVSMNIKDYESKLNDLNIHVDDFKIISSYYIKTEMGAIHLNSNCEITSINGSKRDKLCELFNYPKERHKKRYQLRIEELENEVKSLRSKLEEK